MRRSVKRLGLAAVGLGVVLGLVWGLSPGTPEPAPPVVHLLRPTPTWEAGALTAPAGEHGPQTLGGRVLGPEGPVPGALVVALAPPDAGWRSVPVPPMPWRPSDGCLHPPALASFLEWVEAHRRDGLPLAHATTDAQGRFRLEGLESGPFVLWAEKGPLLGLREAVSAGARDEDVSVWQGRQLSGEVLGDNRLPLPGVRITALVRAAGRVVETLTDEDGRFALGPLPEGEEPLVVSKEGWLTGLAPARTAGPLLLLSTAHRLAGQVIDARGPVADATVQLEGAPAGSGVLTDEQGHFELEGLCARRSVLVARQAERLSRQWVDVGTEPERAVQFVLSASVRLSGRVTDTSGRALADAEVSAQGGGPPAQLLQARTDSRGRFLLEPMVPGLYGVRVQAAHQLPLQLPRRLWLSSQELELEVKPAARLEGVVVDERGAPVEGAGLRLAINREREPELPPVTSGAEGRFALEAPRTGTWRMMIRHPDFLAEELTLSAPARDVRVVLRRSASLEVEVVDAAGRPLERATVSLTGGGERQRGTTGADGRLPLRNLKPGAYTVTACAVDLGRVASVEVPVAAPEPRTVRLVLPEASGRLSGRIVDGGGRPVQDASLSVGVPSPPSNACHAPLQTTSGADGRFSLPPLSEGRWELSAAAEGFSWDIPASRGVERVENRGAAWVRIGPGGAQVQLVLRALPQRELRGRAVREDGTPVTWFQLNGRSVSQPEGRFSQPIPSVGAPWLRLEAPGLAPVDQQVSLPNPGEGRDLGDVVLKALMPIEGRVVDALSSAPVSQALVSVKSRAPPSNWSGVAYTRPDGHFRLEGVPPTIGALTVSHPLYPPVDVALVAGRPVEARLAPGASLSGRVESDNVPVEVGTVQLYSSRGDIVAATELWHGHYSLELLAAGRYTARVLGPRGEGPAVLFALRPVELTAGERATLDFTGHVTGVSLEVLLPGRDIDVYLVPGELPLLSPQQGLYNQLKVGIMGKRVSASARRFSQLPAGGYTLIAIRHDESGADVHREQVELPAEGELSFTLAPLWNRFED